MKNNIFKFLERDWDDVLDCISADTSIKRGFGILSYKGKEYIAGVCGTLAVTIKIKDKTKREEGFYEFPKSYDQLEVIKNICSDELPLSESHTIPKLEKALGRKNKRVSKICINPEYIYAANRIATEFYGRKTFLNMSFAGNEGSIILSNDDVLSVYIMPMGLNK